MSFCCIVLCLYTCVSSFVVFLLFICLFHIVCYVFFYYCIAFIDFFCCFFFFFKQKTAYWMRISAWSSDVCSSDLPCRMPSFRTDHQMQVATSAGANAPLLSVESLSVSFNTEEGRVKVLDDVSFAVEAGRTVGLVGESGCGKSVTAMSVMRLLPSPPRRVDGGRVVFDGGDLVPMAEGAMRDVRGNRIGMVFQAPMTSLNPKIGRAHV